MSLVAAWSALFALAAWGGALAGAALCSGRIPEAGGPRPMVAAMWAFPLAGAAVGCAVALQGEAALRLVVLAFVVFGLAGCTLADLRCGMLPDPLTLAPLAVAIGAGALARDPSPALGAVLVALPFAGLAMFSRGRGMGWGDVKLAALGGALLGAPDAAFAYAFAAAAAYLTARRSGRTREPVAFGPYLATAIVAMLAVVPGS
jgi:prepilin signal peptidase PulO-like enzyme (type II secretory pathway)